MKLSVSLGTESYDIILGHGVLDSAEKELCLARKVLVVTDSGVPEIYSKKIADCCEFPVRVIIPQGEDSKSLEWFSFLCDTMKKNNFTRADCVVAVGGGVVGDLSGFAAACYMRGIDFYNVPTTLLSQVDSSVGGKTGIDFGGVKNIIGAFHQPKKVLIDINTLKTLSQRQLSNGLAESIKMSLTSDAKLFELFENQNITESLDKIIERSLKVKIKIVEHDEKETGLRRVLNFGHTIGHGIEMQTSLLHGECVGLGMLPMCSEDVRTRLLKVLEKAGLPTQTELDFNNVMECISHDKKSVREGIHVIRVSKPGAFSDTVMTEHEIGDILKGAFKN